MIICGPIVRKTTRNELNIWLALDAKPEQLKLAVYGSVEKSIELSVESNAALIKAGKKCFFYMLTSNLSLAEPAHDAIDTLYYEVIIDRKSFGEPSSHQAICIGGAKLPSVQIPKVHKHFIQASCRKPHAKCQKNQIDQLSNAAKLLEEKINLASRPSQLFLTGDQIYADDVSPILLDYIHQLQEYLGLPIEPIRKRNGSVIYPEKLRLDGRKGEASKAKGFTSGEGHSQLLTMSEYLCMYLFSFTGLLKCEGLGFRSYRDLKPKLRQKRSRDAGRGPTQYYYNWNTFNEDITNLNSFSEVTSNDVRRLLANISTYMMFDDHEVTDDWNLTKANARKLANSDVGEHVLQSALGAYFICQHWGNQPNDVDTELKTVNDYLAKSKKPLNSSLALLTNKYWGYELEQCPPVIVLDTRSKREFAKSGRHSLSLISSAQIGQLGQRLSLLPESKTAILVSPTPMYGFSHIEYAQLKFTKFKFYLDREPWIADQNALIELQQAMLKIEGIKDVVVFSGDVHYGFARRHVLSEGGAFWQLCSSACNNVPMGRSVGLKLVNRIIGFFNKENTKYLRPSEGQAFLTSDKNIGTLELAEDLEPKVAALYCRDNKGVTYAKLYDLMNPIEL